MTLWEAESFRVDPVIDSKTGTSVGFMVFCYDRDSCVYSEFFRHSAAAWAVGERFLAGEVKPHVADEYEYYEDASEGC